MVLERKEQGSQRPVVTGLPGVPGWSETPVQSSARSELLLSCSPQQLLQRVGRAWLWAQERAGFALALLGASWGT